MIPPVSRSYAPLREAGRSSTTTIDDAACRTQIGSGPTDTGLILWRNRRRPRDAWLESEAGHGRPRTPALLLAHEQVSGADARYPALRRCGNLDALLGPQSPAAGTARANPCGRAVQPDDVYLRRALGDTASPPGPLSANAHDPVRDDLGAPRRGVPDQGTSPNTFAIRGVAVSRLTRTR
jgi:hypothetical protein